VAVYAYNCEYNIYSLPNVLVTIKQIRTARNFITTFIVYKLIVEDYFNADSCLHRGRVSFKNDYCHLK